MKKFYKFAHGHKVCKSTVMPNLIGFVLIVSTLLIAVSVFNGCKKETFVPIENKSFTQSDAESQKMKNYLVSEYGFSENNIQETEYSFIIEGDVVFPKKDFWENYLHDTIANYMRHYRWPNLVTAITTIPVDIYPSVPSTWVTAITSAITKWNNLNGKVKFNVVNYCPLHGVTITYSSLGSGQNLTMARTSSFPYTNGYPGNGIIINSTCTVSMSAAQKLYTAVHELGHTIGFMHTDDSSGYSQIITTIASCNTGTDPSSVMKQGNNSFSDFSTCDKAAFKKLYPL